MLRTIRADEVRPGDVMSTNGARVEAAVLCKGGGIPDEVCIQVSFEDGSQRFEYVEPDRPVHLWIADELSSVEV